MPPKKRKAESESDEGYTEKGQQATKGEKGGGRGGGKKAKTAGENASVLKSKGPGKKRQTITSEEEQDEEEQRDKRGGYEQAKETHEQDEEEGDKAAEEESREEDDTSEKYTGGPSQSSPGSQGYMEVVKDLRAKLINGQKATKRGRDPLDVYTVALQSLFSEADEECVALTSGPLGFKTKAGLVQSTFKLFSDMSKEEDRNLKTALDSWNARGEMGLNKLIKPITRYHTALKALHDQLLDSSKHFEQRPIAIHSVQVTAEKQRRNAVEVIQENAKVALDARSLIKTQRRAIRAARHSVTRV